MFLVYGVIREDDVKKAPPTTGMGGEAISLFAFDGLAAVVSEPQEELETPAIPELLAYAKVIETFSQSCNILPFRFGCFLHSHQQVIDLLHRRRLLFQAALDEVDGCVEMGLRLLPADPNHPQKETSCESPHPPTGGAAYLASRKAYYAVKDHGQETISVLTRDIQSAFSGLYVKSLVEKGGWEQGRPLAIYFLVPRGNVEQFRKAFHLVEESGARKILLTGPWPPYNFFGHNPSEMQP